jgi:hypothetical protein
MKMRSRTTYLLWTLQDLNMCLRLQVTITCCDKTRRKAGLTSGRSDRENSGNELH